jgi:hypothetical protein
MAICWPVYLAQTPQSLTVLGNGAHLRYLEACFHYPAVAELSMDPAPSAFCAPARKDPIRGSGQKSAVSSVQFLASLSRSGLVTPLIIEDAAKATALSKLIDIFLIGSRGSHPFCAGKDTACSIERLTHSLT